MTLKAIIGGTTGLLIGIVGGAVFFGPSISGIGIGIAIGVGIGGVLFAYVSDSD